MRKPGVNEGTATVEELLRLPEEERYEIVAGVLVPKEGGSGRHGETQGRTFQSLAPFNRRPGPPDRPGGWRFATEVLIEFGPHEIRRPDLAGWRRERLAELPAEAPLRILPDWIAEVVSRRNAGNDTVEKMRLYHDAGVPHYWLLDPRDETLAVYRHTPEGYLHVLGAQRGERVRAEPFEAIELEVAVLFGADEE